MPRFPLRPAPLALAVLIALQGGAALAQSTSGLPETPMEFRIAAKPLGQALGEWALQTRVQLIVQPALVQGKTAPALNSRLTAQQALAQLLQGSGLVARIDGAAVIIQAAPRETSADASAAATALPVVTVSALAAHNSLTAGTSYTASSASSGTGLALSLRETPQSVTVFTRQKMDDLGLQSIEDMAQLTTGLTVARGAPERATFISRGFDISSVILDGMPVGLDGDYDGFNTLSIYDHVEVLRGAAGLLIGSGDPSGVISLSRKRPGKTFKGTLSTSAGSWNNYRGEVDVGGPLNEAGTLRARAVVARNDSDSFIDHYNHKRNLAYATFEADLTPATTVSLGGSYNDEVNNGSAWYGVPTAADGSFLPISRSANYTPAWAYWNKRNKRAFAELEHRFENGWKAKLATYAENTNLDAALTSTSRVDDDTLEVGWTGTSKYFQQARGLMATADGTYSLLGRQHELIVGVNWRKRERSEGGLSASDYSFSYDQTDWQAVAAAPLPDFDGTWGPTLSRSEQTGGYAATRLNLSDTLKLITGARLDKYKYVSGGSVLYSVKDKVTPYVGAVLDLNETYSTYASWTQIFNPQDYRGRSGAVLAPRQGNNIEAGVKAEYFGGALNASAAVFRVRQRNLPISLDLSECAVGLTGCYGAAGEVESKGVEMEASGELGQGWQLSAGYTFNIAHYIEDSDAAAAGTRYRPEQPKHSFKLSTNYRLPGAWSAVRVGGSMRLQNAVYADSDDVRIHQGGYAVLDLMAAWQVTPQMNLQLNINNLMDRTYYESISGTSGGNGFGAPRNVLLTARYQF